MNDTIRAFPVVITGVVLAVISLMFTACNSNPPHCPCPEERACELCDEVINEINQDFEQRYLMDAESFQELMHSFHAASKETQSAEEIRPGANLYFDRSNSMKPKIEAAGQNNGLLSYLLNVVPNNSDYFYLTSDGFEELSASAPKIFIKAPENYTAEGNYAQLDSTIAEMARNNNRQSILITDGELAVRGQTQNYLDIAWAKGHFTKWLGAGNQIDFIIHVVGKERLFFILFTPEKIAGKNDEQSVIRKFIKSTENAGKRETFEWLSFNINDYRLEKLPDGRTFQEQGVNSTMINWMGTEMYTRFEKLEEGYEHFHFEDQEAFVRYVEDFADKKYAEDFDPKLQERNKLFYGLKLTNEFINYQIANLGLRVEDITRAFRQYADYRKCLQSRPVEEQDEEGNIQTYWCNPWFECRDTSSCQYNPDRRVDEVQDIFVLHEETTMEKSPNGFNTADIAIQPSEHFRPEDWRKMGLVKVSVFIKDVSYSNKQDFDLLKWQQEDGLNTGLSESIRLAMQELEPRNKLIYTYYFTYPIDLE